MTRRMRWVGEVLEISTRAWAARQPTTDLFAGQDNLRRGALLLALVLGAGCGGREQGALPPDLSATQSSDLSVDGADLATSSPVDLSTASDATASVDLSMTSSEDLVSTTPSDQSLPVDGDAALASSDLWREDLEPATSDLLDSGCGTKTLCDAQCIDTTSDAQNCGGCGLLCSKGTSCVASKCVCTGGKCPSVPGVWQQLPGAGLPAARMRGLAKNASGHLFVATFAGAYRSLDGGKTFAKLGTPNTVNDPAAPSLQVIAVNSLGEPVAGSVVAGSGTTTTFLQRYVAASNSWVTSSVDQAMSTGGYFPIAIRRDVDGSLLTSWPFRPDIMRSTDGGSSFVTAFPIPNASHVPPSGPSASVKAVYGVASHPISGELFCGTEGDQWWRSTDRGASWVMVDAGGTSPLAAEPGQNGFLVAFNRLGEPLIGTQGKPDGDFLQRVTTTGAVVPSNSGFSAWAMVGTAVESTVLREIALTDEGHNFLAMPVSDNMGGALPADVYASVDGNTWEGLVAPFVPELNALLADGSSVLIGGGTAGVLWRFTPTVLNHAPKVTTGFVAGTSASCKTTGLALAGGGSDSDGDPLTYAWKARGPGVVTFMDPAAAATTASFSVAGDYVLTLVASDGVHASGAPLIVHVSN